MFRLKYVAIIRLIMEMKKGKFQSRVGLRRQT